MIILCLCVLSSPLAACGVKPSKVSPPPGGEQSGFPHTYPNPNVQ